MDEALPPPAEIAARLYSSVLSDVLDSMGLMAQAMRPFVRPLDESLVLFGASAPASTCRAIMSSPATTPMRSR